MISSSASRGSVLIASLWTLSVFTVFVSGIGFQASQQAVLLKKEQSEFESRTDFVSALNLLGHEVENDQDPGTDSMEDSWYGRVALPQPWDERLEVDVTDEESLLDLNYVPQAVLEKLFENLQVSGVPLIGDAEDFAEAVIERRSDLEFVSIDELYLDDRFEPGNIPLLRPYLTVHVGAYGVNLNTAALPVLEAVVMGLSGDDYAKQGLFSALKNFREKPRAEGGRPCFGPEDLSPEPFLSLLELSGTPQNLHLAQQFLRAAVTDSRAWRVRMKSGSGLSAEGIVREQGVTGKLRVVSWRES